MSDKINKDTVDYRDTSSFNDSSLQDVQTIKSAILHKQYGKDVRSALAQLPDSLIKLFGDTGGNSNAEVEEARGGFETLGLHEQAQNSSIDKVTVEVQNARTNSNIKTYSTLKERLDSQENDLDISINKKLATMRLNPEAFANESALRAKYPQGNDQLNVTTNNGHLWIWINGDFKDCGQFQTAGIDQTLVDQIKEAYKKVNRLPELIDRQPTPSHDTVISTITYLNQEWLKMTSTANTQYRGLYWWIDNPDKISAMSNYPVKIHFNIQSSIDQTLKLEVQFYDINGIDTTKTITIDNIALKASEIINYQKEFSLDSSRIEGATKVGINLHALGTNDLGTVLINNSSAVLEYKQMPAEMSDNNASDKLEDYYNLPIIKINGDLSGMTKDNAKQVSYEYRNGNTVLTGFAEIKWQGNSSTLWNKKGYRLKPFKDNTFTKKEKVQFIPSWSATSKINLKAYYTDGLLSRDVVNANIGADIASTNLSLPNDLKQEDNFGFIDGFPIVLIFNGKFEGIYSFNTARSDFDYTKYGIMGNGYTNVTNFTSANKTDVKLDGSDFESLNPETVTDDEKSAVGDLVTWVATSSDENFKADFEKHLDLKTTIDYFILCNLLASTDSFAKNQIFLSWDGVKWFMQAYDFDCALGIDWRGEAQVLPNKLIGTQNNLFKRLAQLFNSEISSRYTELRSWLTPAYVLKKYKGRINEIGVGNYKLEFAKWNNPSKDIATYKQLKDAVLHQFNLLDSLWLK